MRILILIILLNIKILVGAQTNENHKTSGEARAEVALREALSGKSGHNYVDGETKIISDSVTAIGVIEPILFKIYGKSNIKKQRPYNIYFIDKHWIVSGTLAKKMHGGTFLIIVDSRDSRIVKITHGK